MKYTIYCFRPTKIRYRTEKWVHGFPDIQKMWEHVDQCPFGHEVHIES